MARPSDYSAELLKKAEEYLETFGKKSQVIPTIEGLALYLGVSRDTIYDWESQEDKIEFSYILGKLRATQATSLINKGLTGDFNSTMAKMMLSKHGYVEKTESDIKSDGKALNFGWEKK